MKDADETPPVHRVPRTLWGRLKWVLGDIWRHLMRKKDGKCSD